MSHHHWHGGARGQAEPIEACRHLVPSFAHSLHIRRRQYTRCGANSVHGVAFLSWNQHPKPTGLRRATPLLLFQHSAGQSPWAREELRKLNARALTETMLFTPKERCWPIGVPGFLLYPVTPIYFLQTPTQVVLIWEES